MCRRWRRIGFYFCAAPSPSPGRKWPEGPDVGPLAFSWEKVAWRSHDGCGSAGTLFVLRTPIRRSFPRHCEALKKAVAISGQLQSWEELP